MKVKIDYLFSKNDKIGSRLISWGTAHLTDESIVPSHIAVLVNDRWVHESTLESGVRVISYDKWKKINQEVAKISCVHGKRDYSEIKEIYRSIKDKDYDWAGVTYLGLWIGANKICSVDIPEDNKWQSNNRYFCCEAVEKLTGIGPTDMKAPVQLLSELKI